MWKIAEFVTQRERRILTGLGLLVALALLFLIFGGLGERRGYFRSLASGDALRQDARSAEAERDSAKARWQAWDEARRDLGKLRREFFYHKDEGITRLRLDLQQVLGGLGLNPADLKFDYVNYEKDKAQKVSATFTFSGSYDTLRRFLFAVEKFPRLLFAERITFVSIEPRSGSLNLKIAMAAYYEL
jgi:Tfp pilus assembly protein PilO